MPDGPAHLFMVMVMVVMVGAITKGAIRVSNIIADCIHDSDLGTVGDNSNIVFTHS
jgi:hypothetical protein